MLHTGPLIKLIKNIFNTKNSERNLKDIQKMFTLFLIVLYFSTEADCSFDKLYLTDCIYEYI